MEKTECQIKCNNCSKWISSPIAFGDSQSFFNSNLIENNLTCAHCKSDTSCNRENMRFISRLEDSGFMVTYFQHKTTLQEDKF